MSEWREYRKRPVVVLARGPITEAEHIVTLEGTMRADVGDYVIQGVKGERYPCKPDIFAATYDLDGQWDRLAAVARAAWKAKMDVSYLYHLGLTVAALTADDIEAVRDIRWSHDQDCTHPDDIEAVSE